MLHSALRPRLALDGLWQFHALGEPQHLAALPDIAALPQAAWRPIQVPAPWQSQSEDLRLYQGVAYYQRSFDIPAEWAASTIILHFGAVDYHAELWLNDVFVGKHTGGYLPFELDISQAARLDAENVLCVRVTDPDNSSHWQPPFSEIPHGKQSWYGPLSGIWQSVWLEARPAFHISNIKGSPGFPGVAPTFSR